MEKGIIFKEEMVRAILDGRKTMTRRLDKQWLKVKKGDHLWCKETWIQVDDMNGDQQIHYRADGENIPGPWKPSIFMPRWASRITLEATADARLEKLQEISEEDAIQEGCKYWNCGHPDCGGKHSGPRGSFSELWDSLNPKAPWNDPYFKDNPEIVVLEFKKCAPKS